MKRLLSCLIVLCVITLSARNIIVEFKGAYFLPTNDTFKCIYGHGGALYGPELTVELCPESHWYGFVSVDYFQKKGHSIGLCDRTQVSLLPLGFGLKYFVPLCDESVNWYAGLGFQPVRIRTKDCSESVLLEQSHWALGGIAKIGTYVYLPCNFVLDVFVDYSFAKVGCNNRCLPTNVVPLKANVSGAIFGIGLGYLF